MATNSMIPLGTTTLTNNTNFSVVFDSIPSGYRHLVLRGSMLRTTTTSGIRFKFNSNAENIYDLAILGSNGSNTLTVLETYTSGQPSYWVQPGPTVPSSFELVVLDYAQTDKNKTVLASFNRQSGSGTATLRGIHTWRKLDAITKIELYSSGQAYDVGTTVSLYGIG
jgi:hypothetical protein